MNRKALDYDFEDDCIKKLLSGGRASGSIGIAELLNCLPSEINDSEQIEDIVRMIQDMGVTVRRECKKDNAK